MSISSIIRVALTVNLVLFGTGAIGITVGYLLGYVSAVIFIYLVLVKIMSSTAKDSVIRLSNTCKNIMTASIPSLIPKVIGILGINLGTVFVFGVQGAGQLDFLYCFFNFLRNCNYKRVAFYCCISCFKRNGRSEKNICFEVNKNELDYIIAYLLRVMVIL